MTKVAVINPDQKKMIHISEGVHGRWYKIVKYDPNPVHIGQIGIMIPKDFVQLKHNLLISPFGSCFSNENIFMEELSEVTISTKE